MYLCQNLSAATLLIIQEICVLGADVALDILGKDSSLAVAREPYTDKTALHVLARKPSAMGTGSELGIWKRSVNSC